MATTKLRQPRLRASCDGCFSAKVKCSKARPICARCLACGIECRYSPSSRAGKPKADQNGNRHTNGQHQLEQMHASLEEPFTYNDRCQPPLEQLYRMEADWNTPPGSADGVMNKHSTMSTGLSILAVEENFQSDSDHSSISTHNFYDPTTPWTPPSDLMHPFFNEPAMPPVPSPNTHVRSHSFDTTLTPSLSWADPAHHDMLTYSQIPTPTCMRSHCFPTPVATPTLQPINSQQRPPLSPLSGTSCACFTLCLQSLQALHDTSFPSTTPFVIILVLHSKAVENCVALLACANCFGQSGALTATMLLATVIGKITAFYQNASQFTSDHGNTDNTQNPSGITSGTSLGAYELTGEDGTWLKAEILNRELRKLEELYLKFRNTCADLLEGPEVAKALIDHHGQSLASILENVAQRKCDTAF